MQRVTGACMSRFARDQRGATSIEYGLIAAADRRRHAGRRCGRSASGQRRQLGQYLADKVSDAMQGK